MRCIWPRCKHHGRLVPLPLTGELRALCDLHRGPRFLGHMRGLLPHG